MPNKYKTIIGAEIHVELKTDSKMFCGCKNDPFGADKPNTYTCPVCLGLPGALPVPNIRAIDETIMIGLALNCKINNESVFDRKHYFYPDLPKGYQISQQAKPLCYDGFLETSYGTIKINRVHLEEDTAKLIHDSIDGEKVSLIDFNRSGVPLVEIVTEPDIKSADQAKEFLKKIRSIIRFLQVSDADMEKGSMRLEANISLSMDDSLPDYKVEVKNINSFRYYAQAVEYEETRQAKILDENKLPEQETRGWNADKQATISQRAKEEAQEYGYFPEPDIPPLEITKTQVEKIKSSIPKLPHEFETCFTQAGIDQESAQLLARDQKTAIFTQSAIKGVTEKSLIKDIANQIANKKIDIRKTDPKSLADSIKKEKSSKISDESELSSIIGGVISENESVVKDFKSGKSQALGFLMGQVMKKSQGKADAVKASQILRDKLR